MTKPDKTRRCAMCKATKWVWHPTKTLYMACAGCGYSRKAFDYVPPEERIRGRSYSSILIDDPEYK